MARTFRGDHAVILAPWGEPTTDWTCLMQTGCQAKWGSQQVPYQTAPMQQAVSNMRAAGYRGPISIPCIDFANACGQLPDGTLFDGSSWLQSRPADPAHQLIAEAHIYGKNACDTTACFDSSLLPLARTVPLIFGETGETYDHSDCGSHFINTFMDWADHHGTGYETWVWDAWGNCSALIRELPRHALLRRSGARSRRTTWRAAAATEGWSTPHLGWLGGSAVRTDHQFNKSSELIERNRKCHSAPPPLPRSAVSPSPVSPSAPPGPSPPPRRPAPAGRSSTGTPTATSPTSPPSTASRPASA